MIANMRFIIFLMLSYTAWCYEESYTQEQHPTCKGGTTKRMRNGDIMCCVQLQQDFKPECFVIYKVTQQTQRKTSLDKTLEDWQYDVICDDGVLYSSGNQMFCCREDDGGPLDKLCDIVPYKLVPQEEITNETEVTHFNDDDTTNAGKKPPLCFLPPVDAVFSCMAYIERYFYNSALDKCQIFIYGGCRGTQNNFETLEACIAACMT